MPQRADSVGHRAELLVTCDARWLMAYSAAVGLTTSSAFDTANGVTAHPVFPVAPEWALLTHAHDPLAFGMSRDETVRGVHATHRVVHHRPVRQGDEIVLSAEVVGMQSLPSGTMSTVRFDAVTSAGEHVWTSWMGSINRGVELVGDDVVPDLPSPPSAIPAVGTPISVARSVGAGAAHVYTECARIWNPIHTDHAVATAAGLPGIILHGTATLAYAVTAVMEHLGVAAERVVEIAGSFRAMVPVPAELQVVIWSGSVASGLGTAAFEVLLDDRCAIRAGALVYRA